MDTVIEILIDISGSMGTMTGQGVQHERKYLLPDGSTRITLAKKILIEEILPTIDYASRIIIRTFKSEHTTEQKPIITTIFDGEYNAALINQKFSSLPNDTSAGGTPISAAVIEAVNNLKGKDNLNKERKIILVTDGEENGGGDYKVAAEQAMSIDGIKCKIHIVGISLDNEAEKKAKELADFTKGIYLPLRATNYNPIEIKKALAPLKESVVKDSLQNIKAPQIVQTPATTAKIEVLEKKLETVQKEKEETSFEERFDLIQSKIEEHILNSQKLLSELAILKQFKLNSALLQPGVDATTLTIDPDYSESIRQKSESYVFQILTEKYGSSKVKWMNINGESFSNHDFEILDDKGEILNVIECVGTPHYKLTFYLTSKEWSYFLKNKDKYQIYRVFNVESSMSYVCIDNLLSALLDGKVVPYLLAPETLKEHRVFLTLIGA